jgi:hypothetical protein
LNVIFFIMCGAMAKMRAVVRSDNSAYPDPLFARLKLSGDGSPVDLAALRYAAKVADAHAYDIDWRAGDGGLLDNYLSMHARRAWLGDGPRRVLASLVNEPERLPTPGGA